MRFNRRGPKATILGTALALSVAVVPAGCAVGGQDGGVGTTPKGTAFSPLGSYLSARHAEAVGDTKAAAIFYRLALEENPDNINLLRRAYFFSSVEGDVSDAAPLAARLMLVDPGASIAPLVVSAELGRDGRFADVATMADKAGRQGLNSFLTPVLEAWAKAGTGDYEGAMTALDDLDENPGYLTLKSQHAALIAEVMGKDKEAEALFQSYLKSGDRPSLRGVQLAGGYLARHGRAAEARALAADYAARFPSSLLLADAVVGFGEGEDPPALEVTNAAEGMAELHYGTASLLAENDLQTATMFVRLALHLRPDFPLAQLLLGQLMAGQERYDEAIAAYRSVDHRESLKLAASLAEAETLGAAGRLDEAITLYSKIANERPDRLDALVELGDMLRREERFEEAEAVYTRAIERVGTPDGRHWALFFGRGVSNERTQRWPQAESDFLKALDLSPDQPFVLNYLGYSWVDKGINVERAKNLIERAVALRPKDGYIIDSLGWVHYRLGEYDEAVTTLERAIRETPDDPTINDHLGDAYWM
ncbi:MAG: tetratricopeptide repeat protein, partial [Rhodospirillum sp.]|nr:tetratricopeptide repeat protein [Rhodospirillum sp.]